MKRTGNLSKNPSSIIYRLTNPESKAKKDISAVFRFNRTGKLTKIFFNSENDQDQLVLQRGVERLIKPFYFSWVKRLFR